MCTNTQIRICPGFFGFVSDAIQPAAALQASEQAAEAHVHVQADTGGAKGTVDQEGEGAEAGRQQRAGAVLPGRRWRRWQLQRQ